MRNEREHLIERVFSDQSRSDDAVHIMNRLHHTLAMVLGFNSVTQLQSLVNACGSSTWDRSTEKTEFGL